MSRKNRSAIKEKRPEAVTAEKPKATPPPVSLETVPSAVPGYHQKSFPWLSVGVIALLFVGGFAVLYPWDREPSAAPPKGVAEPALVDSDEWALVRRFAELKNANDPKFREFLGSEPVVPDAPISASEAAALQMEFFLRHPFEVEQVRPETRETAGPKAQFALVVKGMVNAPIMKVMNGTSVDEGNRTMYNPDIIVRVEGGKLVGVKAQMHRETNRSR